MHPSPSIFSHTFSPSNFWRSLGPNGYLQWDEVDTMGSYIDTIDSSLSTPALHSLFKISTIPNSARDPNEYAFSLPLPPNSPQLLCCSWSLTLLFCTDGNCPFQRHWTRMGFKIASSTRTSAICPWLGTGMICKRRGPFFPFFPLFIWVDY